MELNERNLKNILDNSLEHFEKRMDSKMHDAIHNTIKEQREEFSREVGVMFEHTNSKIEFIAEKLISVEEKLDAHMIDQAGINKGFDRRISTLEFQVHK